MDDWNSTFYRILRPWITGKKKSRASRLSINWFREHRCRLRVRVPVPENDPAVESLTPLWSGANFLEREVWDLFGIRFIDHPDLRRILLYDEFQGFPLRKDYPVNLCQPRVPERQVEGTFVDERSHNKLLRLKKTLGNKS